MESDFDPYERRSRAWLWILLLLLAAFVGGAAAMGYALSHDARIGRLLHIVPATPVGTGEALPQPLLTHPPEAATPTLPTAPSAPDPQVAIRIATLEDKVDDIEAQAKEATGDASRAEGLLVAFAARRALDRGVELGYIEGLLRQRFGGTQPQAVAIILSASRQPVTLGDLRNGIVAIAPALSAGGAPEQSWWQSFRQELAGMVVVRRVGEPSSLPADRVARAQRMLEAGQVDGALAEIARLPDHRSANAWMLAARRYLVSRAALDQIETAALLDPAMSTVRAPVRDSTPAPEPAKPAVSPPSD